MHWARWNRNGDPGPVEIIKPRRPGSYRNAHYEVSKLRGSASQYSCPCGSQAKDWSYIGGDPDERYGPKDFSATGWANYSIDPDYYEPLCSKCHCKKDGATSQRQLQEYRTLLFESGLSYEQIRQSLGIGIG